MNELEVAQKFGVTTPKTSQELKWNRETFFFWEKFYDENDEEVWILNCQKINNVADIFHYSYSEVTGEGLDAPQVHEIMQLLPKNFKYKGHTYYLYSFGNKIFYDTDLPFPPLHFEVVIEDDKIADAYAQLYIQLRNENLLHE